MAEPFAGGTNVNVVLSHIAEVLLAEALRVRGHRLWQRHRDAGFVTIKDLLTAEVAAVGDGIEQPAFGYLGGSVTTSACGGESRRVLFLHPPASGRSLADWLLQLPDEPVRLETAVGIRDGAKSQGVTFEIQVNGVSVFRKSVQPGAGWLPVKADLSRWRGQTVLLTFSTDSEGSDFCDWATWAEPGLQSP